MALLNITQEQLDDLNQKKDEMKITEAWKILGDNGDAYAFLAARIVTSDAASMSIYERFFYEMVRSQWENTVGAGVWGGEVFQKVAQRHLENYLKFLKNNDSPGGYLLPNTWDIEASYRKAVTDFGLPPSVAIDSLISVLDTAAGNAHGHLYENGKLDFSWAEIMNLANLQIDGAPTWEADRINYNSPVFVDDLEPLTAVILAGRTFVNTTDRMGLTQALVLPIEPVGALLDIIRGADAWLDLGVVDLANRSAVRILFDRIDSQLGLAAIDQLIAAESTDNTKAYSGLIDRLAKTLGIAAPKSDTTRVQIFDNLETISNWLTANHPTLHVASLVGMNRDTLVARAQTDIAYRYALEHLNPFAITGDSGLYAQHNADGHLDAGQTSDLYLQDRAAMLTWTLRLNTQDVAPTASSGNQRFTQNGPFEQPYQFHDIATNTQIRLDPYGNMLPPEPEDYRQIIFGTDQGETLHGNAKADHLYGGGGDDVLDGGDANDHLEGGHGHDTLHGGFGDDTLLGGAGFDTYAHYGNEGLDTIRDSDGQGQVRLDGDLLTGGRLIQAGLWQSEDKQHLYRLNGDTLSIDNRLKIEGFHTGNLGISLGNAPAPVATMQATLTPQADVYGSGYMVGNYLETVEQWIQADTHLSTRIDGGAGNDLLLGAGLYQKANQLRIAQGVTVAIDDTINGGTGRDWINGRRHPTPGAGSVPAWGRYGSRIGKPASRAGGVPCLP